MRFTTSVSGTGPPEEPPLVPLLHPTSVARTMADAPQNVAFRLPHRMMTSRAKLAAYHPRARGRYPGAWPLPGRVAATRSTPPLIAHPDPHAPRQGSTRARK
jgi:hypothetical protein